MCFGHARLITDPKEKRHALVMMVDRFFPHRTAGLRQSTTQEIKATSVVKMEIERASAKIRAKGVGDEEEDYALRSMPSACRCGMVIGEPEPCPRLMPGWSAARNSPAYRPGRLLEEALRDAYAESYPPPGGRVEGGSRTRERCGATSSGPRRGEGDVMLAHA